MFIPAHQPKQLKPVHVFQSASDYLRQEGKTEKVTNNFFYTYLRKFIINGQFKLSSSSIYNGKGFE